MNGNSAWLWLSGFLLIVVGIVLSISPLAYAVFVIRRFRSMSGMTTWAEINILGLMLGFFPPFGVAMAIQGLRFIGHEADHLLMPVIYACIPILALTVVSSFSRLIWSGVSGPRSGESETRSDKTRHSSSDRTEPK